MMPPLCIHTRVFLDPFFFHIESGCLGIAAGSTTLRSDTHLGRSSSSFCGCFRGFDGGSGCNFHFSIFTCMCLRLFPHFGCCCRGSSRCIRVMFCGVLAWRWEPLARSPIGRDVMTSVHVTTACSKHVPTHDEDSGSSSDGQRHR